MKAAALRRHSLSALSLLALLALLILPAFAAARLALFIPWHIAPGLMCVFSLWIYFRLACDKKRAQANEWRITESSLHFCELIGGWPGSFLAQRRFRHKISKGSYQFTFWLIVCTHQIGSFDYLKDFKYSKLAIDLIAEYINRQP
jgi:uncharacterized membrane protein YsdA (DUF1294 family)